MFYNKLTDSEKQKLIKDLYTKQNKSFADIANICNTYANKIRRDAMKWNIEIRNKSEAQKNALTTGKHKHPTKGKSRSEQIKQKIGETVLKSWENLSTDELQERKNKARDRWEAKSEDDKQKILELANEAVRKTSKEGSKLEKFLLNSLIHDGFKVEFHKEQTLVNTKLQIDLFLSSINTAIEVDGPSHFLPVWGEDSLVKNKKYDNKKQGLIIGKGWNLIRIKQQKDFSKARAGIIYDNIKNIILKIQTNNLSQQSFIIEDK